MPTSPMSEVLEQLRSVLLLPQGADLTDGQLLECFVSRREPAAVEALVRRYAPMVWGVCRRVLGSVHDAEDAFQATFLVLVRKAASVHPRAKVGNWLYGVAHQVALKARTTRAKRTQRERPLKDMPEPAVTQQDPWDDLAPLLDQEVSRLPKKYRAAIVLCELGGKTIREAARQLGCPEGTVASRLARGKTMLATRLVRRGLAVLGGTLASVLSQKTASAQMPATILTSTIKAVTLVAAGRGAAGGLISGTVAALTEGVIKAMFLNKLMKAMALLLMVTALSSATGLMYRMQAAEPPTEQPRRRQEALERFHAMSPEERLSFVAKTVGTEKAFVSVAREDLTLTIVGRGSIESVDATDILSRVKRRTTVKWAADDGTTVKKGERLVELDDSALREELRTLQKALEQANAARLAAEVSLQLARKENELAVRSAELRLKVARLELKKDGGKDPERKELLQLKVEQAQLALETAQLRGRARELQAAAELKARASAEEQETKRKIAIEAQLAECVIRAPQAGLVVYDIPQTSRPSNPNAVLAVGEPVRERQKLMRVCGLERFTVLARIHEADVSRVRVGQAAEVRVDAFPGQVLPGRVKEVSPVASQQSWLAHGVKVYPVVVEPTAALPGLRPGLSTEVRLAEARLPKVLQVPVGSVARIGRDMFCYVRIGKGLQERKVTLGARNALNVEIKEGLKEGEEVLRDPGRWLGSQETPRGESLP
jgi:RNA polymerase sigma factor (sigma-70 family)